MQEYVFNWNEYSTKVKHPLKYWRSTLRLILRCVKTEGWMNAVLQERERMASFNASISDSFKEDARKSLLAEAEWVLRSCSVTLSLFECLYFSHITKWLVRSAWEIGLFEVLSNCGLIIMTGKLTKSVRPLLFSDQPSISRVFHEQFPRCESESEPFLKA